VLSINPSGRLAVGKTTQSKNRTNGWGTGYGNTSFNAFLKKTMLLCSIDKKIVFFSNPQTNQGGAISP
jgi:hypothetical protein